MKICYVVYREDNVMVFDSQVLEYLQKLKKVSCIEDVELLLFRHQQNLKRKEQVENKIKKYVDKYKTFFSLAPPLTMLQLKIDALRLKRYVQKTYLKSESVAVICRGDFATYIAAKAFSNMPNSRILYDNRGLPVEESLMAHPEGKIHAINRAIKRKSVLYAKDHCDMYNFVTNPMREYDITEYNYSQSIPYTIIPTLYRADELDKQELAFIKKREHYSEDDYIITYVGSAAIWQSTEQLIELIKAIDERYKKVRYFILTNGDMPGFDGLPKNLKRRITIKSVIHQEMKYYLHISNVGIVIRDNNIVNRVAAPTKIAEYLTSGIKILYSGDIGILTDLGNLTEGNQMINIDSSGRWLDVIGEDMKDPTRCLDILVTNYFDMESRQKDTIEMINNSFKNTKVR